jgi:hypothetical protein
MALWCTKDVRRISLGRSLENEKELDLDGNLIETPGANDLSSERETHTCRCEREVDEMKSSFSD